MRPIAPAVLALVEDAADELPVGLVAALERAGVDVHRATRSEGLARLQEWVVDGGTPVTVLFGERLERPLAAARQVRLIAPLVQLVFIAGADKRDHLKRDMMLTRLIGTYWTFVDPATTAWDGVVRTAFQATRQRSRLRTALDRMNVHLASRREGDAEYGERLPVSNSFLASILEHAGDAIVAVDANGRIATWNRGATVLFGRSEAEVLERPIDMLVAEACRERMLRLVRDALGGRSFTRQGVVGCRSDQSSFDAEVTVAPVRDGSTEIHAASVIVRDVTSTKRHEANLHEANVRLKHALEALEEKTSMLIDLNAQLELLATTDALTGLKNRMVFQNSVDEMVAVASRRGSPLSLLLVDIDHFKRVNDRFGHLVGDRVLQEVARSLVRHTRKQDIVARFGGEEFAILLPDSAVEHAETVAENLRRACSLEVDLTPPLTVSIGVAGLRPSDTTVGLINRADDALYASKHAGRDRVTTASA